MENNEIVKKMIEFQKMSFSNWYGTVSMVQDQSRSAVDMMLEQSSWVPEDGRTAVTNWLNTCREERGRFKAYVEDGFTNMEKYLDMSQKSASE